MSSDAITYADLVEASSQPDNAARPWDPTDDAGYEHQDMDSDETYCGLGPCCLNDGHAGPCTM